MRARLSVEWASLRAAWVWNAVLVPFALTRLAWILAAALARGLFQYNPTYLKYYQQGGQLTHIFLLDIFAHWDAGFYLQIIKQGYSSLTDFANHYSSVAFFPLYPYLVKSIGWLGVRLPDGAYVLIGELLSNLCFLAAMVLLYRLATRHLGMSDKAARRALILVYVYPASFFFSSFYSESLFLLLTVLGFTAAFERRWWLVGVAGMLIVLTRVQGLLAFAALGWIYMEARGWRLRDIRADALWFGLAPAALLAHLYYLYTLTGRFLAPLEAQVAWERNKYGLLNGLWLQINGPELDVYKIDGLMILFFLGCGIYMLWKLPSKSYGIYTILMCVVPVLTGMLISGTRYIGVVFPVFLLLGQKLENREAYDLLRILWFTLQIVYFAGWALHYWVS